MQTSKALYIKDYLLASSIATATATCHQNNLSVVFNHGVVAGSDQIHRLCAAGEGEGRWENHDMVKNLCTISLFHFIRIAKSFPLNTSFLVLLNALYHVLMYLRMAFGISSKVVCDWLNGNTIWVADCFWICADAFGVVGEGKERRLHFYHTIFLRGCQEKRCPTS